MVRKLGTIFCYLFLFAILGVDPAQNLAKCRRWLHMSSLLQIRASVEGEQQHNQDLNRIYKRGDEFSNSSLFFLPEATAFNQSALCPFYQSVFRHGQHIGM